MPLTVVIPDTRVLHRSFIEAGQHDASGWLTMDISALHTIQALAGSVAVRQFQPQQILFEAGAPGDSIFCMLSGTVQLTWEGGGQECFEEGQVFGVGALVMPDHRRHATAQALTACEVLEMNREEFLFAVQETPMFAVELLASLEQRLRRSQQGDSEP
jgi:CRP-like cAMP-binding protein